MRAVSLCLLRLLHCPLNSSKRGALVTLFFPKPGALTVEAGRQPDWLAHAGTLYSTDQAPPGRRVAAHAEPSNRCLRARRAARSATPQFA